MTILPHVLHITTRYASLRPHKLSQRFSVPSWDISASLSISDGVGIIILLISKIIIPTPYQAHFSISSEDHCHPFPRIYVYLPFLEDVYRHIISYLNGTLSGGSRLYLIRSLDLLNPHAHNCIVVEPSPFYN